MMMHHTDTLAYQLGVRPLSVARDISETKVTATANAVDEFRKTHGADTRPEREALWFYLLNHAVGEVRRRVEWHEPLGDYLPILDEYNQRGAEMAARLFNYLLLICIRESRHAAVKASVHKAVAEKYGEAVMIFNKDISGSYDPLSKFSKDPPKVTLGALVGSLRMIFFQAKFGQAYGGPAWGVVADALCKFVDGVLSAEMLLDIGFTLAHNGGPIFNKGMLYAEYNKASLMTILDTQASGQIPQLINGKYNGVSSLTTSPMRKFSKSMVTLLGAGFGADVNWPLVAAHSVSGLSYHGMMTVAQKAEAHQIKVEVQVAAKVALKRAEAEKAKTQFTVMPLLVVAKVKIIRQDMAEAA